MSRLAPERLQALPQSVPSAIAARIPDVAARLAARERALIVLGAAPGFSPGSLRKQITPPL